MVELANLQYLLARSSTKPRYAVLLFRLEDPAAGRAFLAALLPRIAAGDRPEAVGTPLFNVCLSWRAITALVAGSPTLDAQLGRRQLEPFFVDPMQAPDSLAMANQLGFTGPSAPVHWWADFATRDIDLAVYVGSDAEDDLRGLLGELRRLATGFAELKLPGFADGAVTGYLPPGGRLHFGYRDGITSPDVDWGDSGRAGLVDPREFVLGYPTSDHPVAPRAPGPWRDFVRDGSFACITWIYQDVAAFEKFLTQQSAALAESLPGIDAKEWLAAQLMGRWRDGTPLATHPRAPLSQRDLDNSFGYGDDPNGTRCPLDAHIRVAYCRDQPLSFRNASRFPKGPPRLIRRGFSYGEPLASSEDDGKDRGLFGFFLCARINEQFYSILRWMQHTEFSDAFDDSTPGRNGQDRLMGSRLPGGANRAPDTTIPLSLDHAAVSVSLQPFVRYRGVAVLFVPSLQSLRLLAAAPPSR